MKTTATSKRLAVTTAAAGLLILSACQSVYYGTMEKLGYEKRDLLTGRVKDARNAQDAAKNQFKDALEQFNSVVDVKGGDLEAKYRKLGHEFERSQAAAGEVTKRIAAIDEVGGALFKEWNAELKQYTNADLRRASKQRLDETRRRYDQLLERMKATAATMTPVLNAFHDQVLFLKHNLNSQAIASIQGEADKIDADVKKLIRDMEASIAEADAFIASMGIK
jgi:hypothetical protein